MSDNSWLEYFTIAQPGVALNAERRIPGETYERLDVARCILTADGNAANRFITLDYLNGDGGIVARIPPVAAVTAGLVGRFTFSIHLGYALAGAATEQAISILTSPMPPGFTFRISIDNVQAGDQLSAVSMYIRRWPTSEWAPPSGATPYQT